MKDLNGLNRDQLIEYKEQIVARYSGFRAQKLALDMTRGKPSPEQLDLSLGMFDQKVSTQYISEGGVDCRNYGGVEGIKEARRLFAAYLGVEADEVIVGDSSSLKMMHDAVIGAMVYGVGEDAPPWGKQEKVRFLCPSPGYDRHFSVCEYLGIEMIPVGMNEFGPDMKTVEDLVASDGAIKGIWCVPKYSNPTGVTYSDEVVGRLAAMKVKAPDFRIFCDNAYAEHHLTDTPDQLMNFLTACKAAGNPDRVLLFGSTSKISFGGAGVAMMAGSKKNIKFAVDQIKNQTIGPNKLNQLRHVMFFKSVQGIKDHMKKQAAILKPKFDEALRVLDGELGGAGVAKWSEPNGGYFISIDTMDGCAKRVIELAGEVGVKLTPAGAPFPYGRDPRDRNIRIAPSYPAKADVGKAMEVVATCIQLAAVEKLLVSG